MGYSPWSAQSVWLRYNKEMDMPIKAYISLEKLVGLAISSLSNNLETNTCFALCYYVWKDKDSAGIGKFTCNSYRVYGKGLFAVVKLYLQW